jgi:cell wall-associated NlpC family hydrolase
VPDDDARYLRDSAWMPRGGGVMARPVDAVVPSGTPTRSRWRAGLIGAVVILTAAGCASAPPRTPPTASPSPSRVVSIALKHVGAPYARGGASPAGFDCSGFVMFVYGRVGIALPHSAEKQYRMGAAIARSKLEPGDIVFFDRLGHSGIYVGQSRFVHATKPGDVVKVSSLDEDWYRRRWVGARRVL